MIVHTSAMGERKGVAEEIEDRRRQCDDHVERKETGRSGPVYVKTCSRSSETNVPLRLPLEPFQSPLVILEERCDLVVTSLIVFLDPCFFFFREHVLLHHPCLNWHAGEAFKAQPDVTIELAFRLKGDVIDVNIVSAKQKKSNMVLTLTLLTTNALSIRIPHWPSKSG